MVFVVFSVVAFDAGVVAFDAGVVVFNAGVVVFSAGVVVFDAGVVVFNVNVRVLLKRPPVGCVFSVCFFYSVFLLPNKEEP